MIHFSATISSLCLEESKRIADINEIYLNIFSPQNFHMLASTESGAVFAFGRSHLTISGDGNDNNYFFIKKDKIKKLICGHNQSAVICGKFLLLL